MADPLEEGVRQLPSADPAATAAALVEPTTPLDGAEVPRQRRFRTFDSVIDVPAFRWYLLSQTGNWSALQMQQVARSFLAYYITGSFAALAWIELANTVPRLFLAIYGGVLADRASRRVILQVGQVAQGFLAAALATLLFTDQLRIEHLVLASLGQGILNSFVQPARQAMIPEIVGPGRLTNAFALNVFVLNVLRLGAPALAGLIIALLGAGWVFASMVALNVFAILALFPVPRTNAATRAARSQLATGGRRAAPPRQGGLADIRDGIAYLKRERVILWLIGIHGTTQMLALPYQRLLPGFVAEVLSGSEDETAVLTGVLLSLTAVGALVGSLLIASLPDRQRGKLLIYSLVVFGIGLTAFSASNVLLVSAGVVLVLGVGQSMRQSLANILIQSHVEDDYRGRVSALMLMDDGLESLGIFAVALVADMAGSQWALGSVGVLLVAYGLLLWTSKPIRQMD